jgi:hypothetical protein
MVDMYQKEIRYLLAKLQEWDVTGEGKCGVDEIYQVIRMRTKQQVRLDAQ